MNNPFSKPIRQMSVIILAKGYNHHLEFLYLLAQLKKRHLSFLYGFLFGWSCGFGIDKEKEEKFHEMENFTIVIVFFLLYTVKEALNQNRSWQSLIRNESFLIDIDILKLHMDLISTKIVTNWVLMGILTYLFRKKIKFNYLKFPRQKSSIRI